MKNTYRALITLMLMTVTKFVYSQDEKIDTVSTFINQIYSLDGFQQRLGNSLDYNETFQRNIESESFINELTEIVKSSALSNYSSSIRSMIIESFSVEEIVSMSEILDSPDGELIRKLFKLDNSIIEQQLDEYVLKSIRDTESILYQLDSILYHKEYPISLQKYMVGEFLIVNLPIGKDSVKIKRTEDFQIEYYQDQEIEYKIEWINNSKYALILKDRTHLLNELDTVVANIYEINDSDFRYIFQLPTGEFYKGTLHQISVADYEDQITLYQAQLNDDYFNVNTTPLKNYEQSDFIAQGGHAFYSINPRLKIKAKINLNDDKKIEKFQTSSMDSVEYYRYGIISFELEGKEHQLAVYTQDQGLNKEVSLFIPFTDLTSGNETYGGGRYINCYHDMEENYLYLDFNKAYYPYCRYSDGYSCPIPPLENHLESRIEAGIRF